MTIINQLLAAGIICYTSITLGILYTLPSSRIKLFRSENTTLNRVMTETEISLMGSIPSLSTLLIMPFCGYLLDVFGRKRSMILFFLSQVLAWVLLVSLKRVESFICAMFLCGLGDCNFLIVPVYINEFCKPSIRGALSTGAMLFHAVGMLISYGLGGILEYNTMNYLGLTLVVFGLVLISCFLRESPLYLMKKGFKEEAAKSIAFYRGLEPNCKVVITEMENIRRLLDNSIKIDDIPEMERLQPEVKEPNKKLSILKFLKKSPSTRRALAVLLVLYTTCIFQGLVTVQIFAKPLFTAALPSVSPTLSSIIFGLTVVFSGLCVAYLLEAVGRRILLIVFSTMTGILCVIVGTLIQLQLGPGWLIAVLIYTYSITYYFGAGAVPYVLVGEIFLPEIKSFASTFVIEWMYLCNFFIVFMFTPLFNSFGLGPIFHVFAGFSFFTALFAFFYLPETKNLPVDVIQQKFLER